jgi:glycine betaine/choline ABC-type transport system substrate-binding protein/ABC-type proline/glycine betaine transport system permease subunit
MTELIHFWTSHSAEFAARLGQHIVLVAISTGISAAIGVPLGIFSAHRPRVGAPIVAVANIVQTVPSLAMFGFLLPVPLLGGVGARAALVVLILYGLLPILRTTIAGVNGIDRAIREAAVALGMTPRDLLWQVEFPLAMPSIVAGIRIAAVVGVGSATIAAAIGAGGLGEYIYRGLSMVDSTVLLAGAIPAALLALIVDAGLWFAERQFSKRRRRRQPLAVVAMLLLASAAALAAGATLANRATADVVVGSKNFTEQVILGELLAQKIERDTGLIVERRLNLGGTLICERALAGGDIDVYVEYTGTSLTAIFHQPIEKDSRRVFDTVRELYARSGRTVLPPLGFNNTFAILVRGQDARELRLKTIDDAARLTPGWRAGFGYEFLERPDGYPGLSAAYNLRFARPPSVMDLSLSYRALASGQVDLIAGDATAGLIKGLDLFRLEDNRHYFPPYDAVPVARAATLLRYPEVLRALAGLAGQIPADAMQAMNDAVDARHEDPAEVVRRFLAPR